MNDYRKVAVLENEIEARLLEAILLEREIPHLLRSYHDTAYNGLFQAQKGWGIISAPNEFHGRIDEILADIRQGADEYEEPAE
jgi:hypothetical protein